jgi:transcriptional regulator with XRE-family HTH domain/transposase-like protein
MSHQRTLSRPRPPVRFADRPRQDPACAATKHGTYTAYARHSCRCPSAREDWRLYNKRRREGRAPERVVDATGTRRRLQALATQGWSQLRLATELGCANSQSVGRILRGDASRVNSRTRDAIAALYDRLAMTPGPSDRARDYARHAGWVPPLDWDDSHLDDPAATPIAATDNQDTPDPVAVQRACDGDKVTLTPAERDQVVAQLGDAGRSANAIADQLGLSHRHVQRIRTRLSAASAPPGDGQAPTDRPPDLAAVNAKVHQAREAVAKRTAGREPAEPTPDLPRPTRQAERSTPCLTV